MFPGLVPGSIDHAVTVERLVDVYYLVVTAFDIALSLASAVIYDDLVLDQIHSSPTSGNLTLLFNLSCFNLLGFADKPDPLCDNGSKDQKGNECDDGIPV